MEDQTRHFYDCLADDYHLIFQDWEAAQARQARLIAGWLEAQGIQRNAPILDCACGIGTQVLGLASLEYDQVWGTDISPRAIQRAETEARKKGLHLPFATVDIRNLANWAPQPYRVILAIDNVLPHFLTAADLQCALSHIRDCLAPDGLFIASVRRYDELRSARPKATSIVKSGRKGQRVYTFQEWNWETGTNRYRLDHYTVKQDPIERWQMKKRQAFYRAWSLTELAAAYQKAGYKNIKILKETQSGFYQPVLLAQGGRKADREKGD
jgi:SAM-dependent methyltransferase